MPSGKDKIEQLQRYLEGRLEPDEVARLEERLETDDELRRLLQLVRDLKRETPRKQDLRIAAQRLVERLVRDLKQSRKTGHHGLMTFDSGLLPLPAGIRPATLDSRRLKFAADEFRLDVSVYPASPGTFEVIGQAEGFPQDTILEVTLKRGRITLKDTSNPFQVFHFPRVPNGTHLLTVTDPDGKSFDFTLEL